MTSLSFPGLFTAVVFSLVLALTGCASSGPEIHSVYEVGTNFGKYKTFAFLDQPVPEGLRYPVQVSRHLRAAIAREMENRGIRQAEQADLLIGFYIHTQEKIQTAPAPMSPQGYYGYRSRYNYRYGAGFGNEILVSQYTEGTLNIDVVDRAQNQLIWEGIAVGQVKNLPPEKLEERANEIVSAVFAEYPVRLPK